ncbi:hypothetical protein, partial [Roseobacter litoralis]|uniref:hypothetical protein n=1 Tax=Roseobacter litoralis TaxID=42443 RepID=UPI00249580BA
DIDGKSVRSARPMLERAEVIDSYTLSPEGDRVEKRARVWRTVMPQVMKTLNPDHQAAMLSYAEIVERVGASTGTSDPTGGGGGCSGPKAPSLSLLIAAEQLRRMHDALDGHEVQIDITPERRGKHNYATLSFRDLVCWVAIDGLGRHAILKRMGAPHRNPAANAACILAITEAAQILDECFGYIGAPTQNQKKRNTLQRNV